MTHHLVTAMTKPLAIKCRKWDGRQWMYKKPAKLITGHCGSRTVSGNEPLPPLTILQRPWSRKSSSSWPCSVALVSFNLDLDFVFRIIFFQFLWDQFQIIVFSEIQSTISIRILIYYIYVVFSLLVSFLLDHYFFQR